MPDNVKSPVILPLPVPNTFIVGISQCFISIVFTSCYRLIVIVSKLSPCNPALNSAKVPVNVNLGSSKSMCNVFALLFIVLFVNVCVAVLVVTSTPWIVTTPALGSRASVVSVVPPSSIEASFAVSTASTQCSGNLNSFSNW